LSLFTNINYTYNNYLNNQLNKCRLQIKKKLNQIRIKLDKLDNDLL